MNWTTKVSKIAAVIATFGFSSGVLAEFNSANLGKRFSGIKLADHSAIFTRLRDGKVLMETNPDMLLSPASATKILTSALALNYFGPSFTFKTPVFYTGKIEKNKLHGDLYIKGNGDPFIISEVLWQAAVDLRHLGIHEIQGSVIVDNSLFDNETRDESRVNSTQKSTHAYDAPVSALAINFNTIAVATAPTAAGRAAISEVTPFPLRHVKLSGRTLTTNSEDSGQVSLSRNASKDGGITLRVGGTIGIKGGLKKLYRSAGDPTVASADYILGFLEKAGIKVSGKAKQGKVPENAKLVYEIVGPEMRRIVQGLNTFSNNFIADMLTKRLGAALGNPSVVDAPSSGSMEAGTRVLSAFLRDEIGIKSDFKISNGSGLSTENRLSAKQLASVLNYMESKGELYPDFLASLPANGWDGTMRKRMQRDDALAGQIRAKSGTLTEPITVAALAGYFRHPREGWISFVMISNGREGKAQPGLQDVRNAQDDVLKGIFND